MKIVKKTKSNTIKFGPKYIGFETPSWATWAFRIFFWATSVITIAINTLTKLPLELKLQISEIVTISNIAAHSFSKMFGIVQEN